MEKEYHDLLEDERVKKYMEENLKKKDEIEQEFLKIEKEQREKDEADYKQW